MLENIYKISNEKIAFLSKMHNSSFESKLQSEESAFQVHAIRAIEAELTLKNMLILSKVLNSVSAKFKRDFLSNAKYTTKSNLVQRKSIKQRETIFLIHLLSTIVKQHETENKLICFKKIEKQHTIPHVQIKMKHQLEHEQLKSGFQQLEIQNNKLIPINHKNNLSFLDISIIQPLKSREIGSICDLDHFQRHIREENKKQNLIAQLEQKIKIQIQKIEEYQETQTKEIKLLRQKIQQQKNMISQDSCSSDHPIQNSRKIQLQTESISDVLLAKFIRKNFELQQKLSSVYELLSAISPDLTTQFGTKLNRIMRKNTMNIDIQEIRE